MNDRAYIEELLGYLKLGIKEKKKAVENIYKDDISQDEYLELKDKFYSIIDRISVLDKIKPISNTRYKQKNDFYTLFSFINENLNTPQDLLNYQYEVLLILDKSDEFGRQYIRPTNEECNALKEYATNCVSQSNSTRARESRLLFFNSVLKNTDIYKNDILTEIANYLSDIYGPEKVEFIEVNEFKLLNISLLN